MLLACVALHESFMLEFGVLLLAGWLRLGDDDSSIDLHGFAFQLHFFDTYNGLCGSVIYLRPASITYQVIWLSIP